MNILFPPRPQTKIAPNQLNRLESQKVYLCQRKFRGSRNLVRYTAGKIELYSRHGKPHAKFKPSKLLISQIKNLNFSNGQEYWLDSELLNFNGDYHIVFYDVLYAGKYLYGVKQTERLELLADICGNPQELASSKIALAIASNLMLAEYWFDRFQDHFNEFIHLDCIEGLLLRKKDSFLDNFGSKEYEVDWQLRCRKPGPNYQL